MRINPDSAVDMAESAKSLNQVHAIFIPDAAQAVNRFPLNLSWDLQAPQF